MSSGLQLTLFCLLVLIYPSIHASLDMHVFLSSTRPPPFHVLPTRAGLPHSHNLRTFSSEDRLRTPEDYDQIVRSDIPDPILEPRLHAAVMKHMLHNRCGVYLCESECRLQKTQCECCLHGPRQARL